MRYPTPGFCPWHFGFNKGPSPLDRFIIVQRRRLRPVPDSPSEESSRPRGIKFVPPDDTSIRQIPHSLDVDVVGPFQIPRPRITPSPSVDLFVLPEESHSGNHLHL